MSLLKKIIFLAWALSIILVFIKQNDSREKLDWFDWRNAFWYEYLLKRIFAFIFFYFKIYIWNNENILLFLKNKKKIVITCENENIFWNRAIPFTEVVDLKTSHPLITLASFRPSLVLWPKKKKTFPGSASKADAPLNRLAKLPSRSPCTRIKPPQPDAPSSV